MSLPELSGLPKAAILPFQASRKRVRPAYSRKRDAVQDTLYPQEKPSVPQNAALAAQEC